MTTDHLNETMSEDDDTIELTHSYAEKHEDGRATVKETVYIDPSRSEDIISRLVFQMNNRSERGRWEKLKEYADRVEIDRTVHPTVRAADLDDNLETFLAENAEDLSGDEYTRLANALEVLGDHNDE